MMKGPIATVGVLATIAVEGATSTGQVTHGWCSPAVSHVGQNVTIVCRGVDPKALARLNELLDLKDRQLGEKIREADNWARKYHEINSRLVAIPDPSEQERRAITLLKEGRLEEAGQVLDQLLTKEDDVLRRLARYNYNRAEVYELQFYPLKALPHYRKAVQYDSTNVDYALALANSLARQGEDSEARPLYDRVLVATEAKATAGDTTALLARAKAFERLARVVRPEEEGQHHENAVASYRRLNQTTSGAYTFELARALATSVSMVTRRSGSTEGFAKMERVSNEAADLFEKLAAADPPKRPYYLSYALAALMTLATLERAGFGKQDAFKRMLALNAQIRASSKDYFSVEMAGASVFVSTLYLTQGQAAEAEETASAAISIIEKTTRLDDKNYQALPQLYLARSYALSRLGKREQALESLEQAARVLRQLAERNPTQYGSDLLASLKELADAQRGLGRNQEAARTEDERRVIREKYDL